MKIQFPSKVSFVLNKVGDGLAMIGYLVLIALYYLIYPLIHVYYSWIDYRAIKLVGNDGRIVFADNAKEAALLTGVCATHIRWMKRAHYFSQLINTNQLSCKGDHGIHYQLLEDCNEGHMHPHFFIQHPVPRDRRIVIEDTRYQEYPAEG